MQERGSLAVCPSFPEDTSIGDLGLWKTYILMDNLMRREQFPSAIRA